MPKVDGVDQDERLTEGPEEELEAPPVKLPEKYYKCTHEGCTSSYNKPSHLERHLRGHSGQVLH